MPAKLDDPALQERLLAQIKAGDGLRPACKAVGVSRTSLQRYMDANPAFAEDIERARALMPRKPKHRRPKPPAAVVELEVVRAELAPQSTAKTPAKAAPPAAPAPPTGGWWTTPDGMAAKAAMIVDDEDAHPAKWVAAWRYIGAKLLAEPPRTQAEDVVYVELPPKDAAADG